MKRILNSITMAVVIIAAMASSTCFAAVNLERYMGESMGLMPAKEAKEVLADVFKHNPVYLDELSVEVFKIQKRSNLNVALIYVGRQQDYFDTEMYAVTFDAKWNRIDATLLGYSGDAVLLIPTDLPEDIAYEPDLDLNFSMRGDTLKMEREYKMYSKKPGGKSEHGVIISRFLLRRDGKLHQWPIDVKAKNSNGNIDGTFDYMGVSIMNFIQCPLATPPNFLDWNEVAKNAINVASKYGNTPPQNMETKRNADFAEWITNAGISSGEPFFSWVAKNLRKQAFTYFVKQSVTLSGMKEDEWLKSQVKACKDKKTRKLWQQWMKEELKMDVK